MRGPNVYEMYVANDCHSGFWVQRNSWGNTCAHVKMIGGRRSGPLPGVAPYFLSVAVHADIYDLWTGELKDSDVLLSCPGTFAYKRIAAPPWSAQRDAHAE
jgi:hypothetical protein